MDGYRDSIQKDLGITFVKPNIISLAVAKEGTVYMGLKGSTQVIL